LPSLDLDFVIVDFYWPESTCFRYLFICCIWETIQPRIKQMSYCW